MPGSLPALGVRPKSYKKEFHMYPWPAPTQFVPYIFLIPEREARLEKKSSRNPLGLFLKMHFYARPSRRLRPPEPVTHSRPRPPPPP